MALAASLVPLIVTSLLLERAVLLRSLSVYVLRVYLELLDCVFFSDPK